LGNRRGQPRVERGGQVLAGGVGSDRGLNVDRRLLEEVVGLLVRPQEPLNLLSQLVIRTAGGVEKRRAVLRRLNLQGGQKQRVQVGLVRGHRSLRRSRLRTHCLRRWTSVRDRTR